MHKHFDAEYEENPPNHPGASSKAQLNTHTHTHTHGIPKKEEFLVFRKSEKV
jgi:hypothetical protein